MYPTNSVNLAQAKELSLGRDCIQRTRRGLAQASPSRSGETTLALRLGELSNQREKWVAVVLA